MIKVVFFAALREQLDCSSIELDDAALSTVAQVKEKIVLMNPNWQNLFNSQSLLMAVNHDMVDANHKVKSGDEIAFFPPVTGG